MCKKWKELKETPGKLQKGNHVCGGKIRSAKAKNEFRLATKVKIIKGGFFPPGYARSKMRNKGSIAWKS